jgi:hypothetical protein
MRLLKKFKKENDQNGIRTISQLLELPQQVAFLGVN